MFMGHKQVVGYLDGEIHKELARICALENCSIYDKVGQLITDYVESKREVHQVAGEGAKGMDGQGGKQDKGDVGAHTENSGKIEWLT